MATAWESVNRYLSHDPRPARGSHRHGRPRGADYQKPHMTSIFARFGTPLSFVAAAVVLVSQTALLRAQGTGDQATERRARTGALLARGWHPYGAVAPVSPLGRLGELTTFGVSGHLGAWYVPPEGSWPGVGVEASYATLAKDTDEQLPGAYQKAGVSVRLTSKGKRRVLFDWLGAYGAVGAGVFRHGASQTTMQTSPSASASVGMLVPVYGLEGFVEARFEHLFSGQTLGRGNGITMAPLMLGVRF